MRAIGYSLLLAAAIFSAGCATSRNTANYQASAEQILMMYPLSLEQADLVLIEAMKYQFPDAPIVRVELPYKGYFVTRRFGLDSHDFTARMVPAKGTDDNGNSVNGYTFEVIDEGTMLISGRVRGSSLFDKIVETANSTTKPIRLVK